MKLYKFRTLANIERLLDIVLHERLYCAHFTDLNDPFEGVYLSRQRIPRWPLGTGAVERTRRVSASALHDVATVARICSLSAYYSDLRLWAHYGDGHRGVAVEVDFSGHEADLHRVDYLHELPQFNDSTIIGVPFPDNVLTKKTVHWEHEREYRVLQSQPHYSIEGRITSILLGARVAEDIKLLLHRAFEGRVALVGTRINERTLEVEARAQDA